MNPALALTDVTLRFGGIIALDSVDLAVLPGTIHAVIGPNGAGKSSLFNVISGHVRPQSGAMRLDGADVTWMKPHLIARRGVGRAFQNIALSAHESVLENLMAARHRLTRAGFITTALGLPASRREDRAHRARVTDVATFVGLGEKLAKPAGTLAYGERKRVEIARALCTEPRVLLLDEPVAGMPVHEKWDVAELVLSVRKALGIAVLLVEHDMPFVLAVSDRVTVLDFGQRIADGTPAQVVESPAVAAAYLGSPSATSPSALQLIEERSN